MMIMIITIKIIFFFKKEKNCSKIFIYVEIIWKKFMWEKKLKKLKYSLNIYRIFSEYPVNIFQHPVI
jgi:hypothetical protein